MRTITVSLAAALLLPACSGEGVTTDDVKQAATERARQELGIPAGAPLEAAAWTGGEWGGDLVVCGTVSAPGGGGGAVRPQRFIATTDPFRWLVFEDAHAPMVQTQPNKFPEWTTVCNQEGRG